MSSLGKSIAAGMPYNAPPVEPQTSFIQGSPVWAQHLDPAAQQKTGSAVVVRGNRLNGMRFRYARGGQTTPWFRMKATGQVERSKFQPTLASTFFTAHNDALYRAGYPRNLGLSEKVATIPPEALGTERSQMTPRPRYTRSVFTNRNFATAPGIAAQPTAGVHS